MSAGSSARTRSASAAASPELSELEQGARQHGPSARQFGIEFEGAPRRRGRLPRPVHPVVHAGRREVRLGVAGFQFDQPPQFPERSLQLARLPVGLAAAQEALRVHRQQVDLGAARVALVKQRRQATRRLGQAPRAIAVARTVPGARQHGDDGLGSGAQLVGPFEVASGLVDLAAREGEPAEAEVRHRVVGFETRGFPVMLVRAGGEADLLQGGGEPDAGRRVRGVEFDGAAEERRRRGRIARLLDVGAQVDPAEVAGGQARGLGIGGRGLVVELVSVESHGKAAPGGGRVGFAGGTREFLLDGGPYAAFDGGEIGGREFGGRRSGGDEAHEGGKAPHRPSPRRRVTSLPLATPSKVSTEPPGQVTSKRSTAVASPRPMWSGASPPVR